MAYLIVDSMDNATPWKALAPDGVTTSQELSLTIDDTRRYPVGITASAKVSATANAVNHKLRRNFSGLDLTNFDEIRLWIYSDRPADGSLVKPFFLEMRFASPLIQIDAPNNSWQRYLPVSQIGTWESVRLSIGDLPAGIRSSVNLMQLRCTDAGLAFSCNIDDIIAVRDEMLGDVDAALLVLLNNTLILNGNPVRAVLHPANGVLSQARPYIEITQYDVVYSRERTQSTLSRRDYSDAGYSVRSASNAYEIFYQFTAVADDRPTQSKMLEFILRTLTPRGSLLVNSYMLPMETVKVNPRNQIGGFRTDQIPLFYRISSRQEVGDSESVTPAKTLSVNGDIVTPV